MAIKEGPLGRLTPPDFVHVERFHLTPQTVPSTATPVIIGVNWYQAFDRPEYDASTRRFWVARNGDLGRIRGGHSVCLKPPSLVDPLGWWRFYDQGSEGACVGFASSRAMSLLNRKRYDARWLYHEAQWVDAWAETPPEEGTSVRAAIDILRNKGHVLYKKAEPDLAHGILENRWAVTVEEVVECLGSQSYLNRLEGVPLLNSWGIEYPHIVWMPFNVMQRLLDEDGEATIFTDRV